MADRERKLTTIVAIDVAGYSRLMHADETGTLDRLKQARAISDPIGRAHGGRIVGTSGDGVLAEFPSVVEAVAFALRTQAAMAEFNIGVVEDEKMLYRIGINLGDVLVDGDDLFGDGVNVAARLETLAEPGSICISQAARDQVRDKIEAVFKDLGEVEVKNIARPVHVFEVTSKPETVAALASATPLDAGPHRRRRLVSVVFAAAALLFLVTSGTIWWWLQRPNFEPADPTKFVYAVPEKPSIAVLPFDNLSGDPAWVKLGDSLAENITAVLATSPDLFVIARNSSFVFKGKATRVQEIAEQLGVRYVLEGSVQQTDDKLRVTAQLIDAISGTHLWAERYDRDVEDLLAVQDGITQKIVVALRAELTLGIQASSFQELWGDFENFHLAMLGRAGWLENTLEGYQKANRYWTSLYNRAPDHAGSYEVMAWLHEMKVRLGVSKAPAEDWAKARGFAEKAVALIERRGIAAGSAHAALAFFKAVAREHDSAISHVQEALRTDPGGGITAIIAGTVLDATGFPQEGVNHMKRAMRLEPYHATLYPLLLSRGYMQLGQYDKAKELLHTLLRQPENNTWTRQGPLHRLAVIAVIEGNLQLARRYIARYMEVQPDANVMLLERTAIGYMKNREFVTRYLDALRQAGLPEKPPQLRQDKPSIAVLPFVNISNDTAQEYFADGMTDDLIIDLSKLSGLTVIARNSVFTYKGRNAKVQDIARDLNVTHVLEGSVRRAGGQVRINAQLIDADTGAHLWAETFDRPLADVFALQDDVTGRIIAALTVTLTPDERQRLTRVPTGSLEAYELYLKARDGLMTYRLDRYGKVLTLFQKAIELDPDFAEARGGLAQAASVIWSEGWVRVLPPVAARTLAQESATRALETDPENVTALQAQAWLAGWQGEHAEAIRLARKSIALEPNDAEGHFRLAHIFAMAGEPLAANAALEEAHRLEPHPAVAMKLYIGWTWLNLRRYGDIVALLSEARREQPALNPVWVSVPLAVSHAYLNQPAQAASEIEKARKAFPAISRSYYRTFLSHYRRADDITHVLEGLRRAGLPEWPFGFNGHDDERLTGSEIAALLFDHRISGKNRSGTAFEMAFAKDGRWTWHGGDFAFSGNSRIENDRLCLRSAELMRGRDYCHPYYRNPQGRAELHNEYVYASIFDVAEFSVAE